MRSAVSLLMLGLGLSWGTAPAAAQVWDLVWADEFDYQGLPDGTRWSYDVGGHGWGNNEAQYYTSAREKNARVDGSALIIEAHKESYQGKEYTSARLVTKAKGDWAYGRILVRAKLPSGRGTWPAIWMLPTNNPYGNGSWPDNGEIDIMEHVGYDAGRIHAAVHTNKYNHQRANARGDSRYVGDAETAFHEYSVDWTPTRMDFAVDGNVYFTYHNEGDGWVSWPFDREFHLLLNIAIGGRWGGAQGIDDSIFPQQFVIDYVRVYRYIAQPYLTFMPPNALTAGDTLRLAADATDADGVVHRVEFRQGDAILSQHTSPPYEHTIQGVHPGCYKLTALAIDDLGWTTAADTTVLTVGQGCDKAPYLVAPHAVPGRIEAEYFDLGGPNIGYFDLNPSNFGDGIRQSEGVEVYRTTDGSGYHVQSVRHEWLAYTVRVVDPGLYTFFVRLSTYGARAAFTLSVDGVDQVLYDDVVTPNQWGIVFVTDVALDEGVRDLRLTVHENNTSINWLRFIYSGPLSTEEEPGWERAMLHENYPNPFRDATTLAYTVTHPGPVQIEVFNALGQRVTRLADHHHSVGRHRIRYDASGLGAGLYFYRLTSGATQQNRIMVKL